MKRTISKPPRRLPAGVVLEAVAGEDPALVLVQGPNRVRVPLSEVQVLAALTDAAVALASVRVEEGEHERPRPC